MKESKISIPGLKDFLDKKAELYNNRNFIETDPIQIPHLFSDKNDIEIAGFLTATIAWGQRKSIISNARKLLDMMDMHPFGFISGAGKRDLKQFEKFVHRTFNGTDTVFFVQSLQNILKRYGSIENAFIKDLKKEELTSFNTINNFRQRFFEIPYPSRTQKHVSSPLAGSSAKRLCMYLRWMVRNDKTGVDFGIWTKIRPSELCLPLDVHTGNVSRKLGLLTRTQNDWKSVMEVTEMLKKLDPIDPIRYDFALFGLGAFEKF